MAAPLGSTPVAVDDGQGNTFELDPATFIATEQAAGLTVLTPTQTFNFAYGGQILTFNYGEPFNADPQLQAALTAAGAPVQ
ncbi:hypothetical protein [Aquitalea aquatilis]|uniref:hypothetical protein n=1 Tax=Aquitalea aquatilis TaxID=1537400 RepID=UPI0010BCFF20|nr:hypothetical protein [Aquitalea aquatilis]